MSLLSTRIYTCFYTVKIAKIFRSDSYFPFCIITLNVSQNISGQVRTNAANYGRKINSSQVSGQMRSVRIFIAATLYRQTNTTRKNRK